MSTHRPNPRSAAGASAQRLGWIALAVAAAALIVLAATIWPLIRLNMNPPPPPAAARPDEPLLKAFADDISKDLAQIEGRSLFAVPPPPRPRTDVAKKSTPRPTRYGGPSVIGMVNNQVWLANGDRISEGESKGGVRVLALNAPWSARLEWDGAEFEVDLFARTPLTAAGPTAGAAGDSPAETRAIPPRPSREAGDAGGSGVRPAPAGTSPPAPPDAGTAPAEPPPEEPGPQPAPEPAPSPPPPESPSPSPAPTPPPTEPENRK